MLDDDCFRSNGTLKTLKVYEIIQTSIHNIDHIIVPIDLNKIFLYSYDITSIDVLPSSNFDGQSKKEHFVALLFHVYLK